MCVLRGGWISGDSQGERGCFGQLVGVVRELELPLSPGVVFLQSQLGLAAGAYAGPREEECHLGCTEFTLPPSPGLHTHGTFAYPSLYLPIMWSSLS